mmetsp:Transcript_27450/g.53878  ORF Transcript_27450/g.53878 Transcript_27450/m.53878 type:complete len:129 (-) Transcript_27450:1288-1674(-)
MRPAEQQIEAPAVRVDRSTDKQTMCSFSFLSLDSLCKLTDRQGRQARQAGFVSLTSSSFMHSACLCRQTQKKNTCMHAGRQVDKDAAEKKNAQPICSLSRLMLSLLCLNPKDTHSSQVGATRCRSQKV